MMTDLTVKLSERPEIPAPKWNEEEVAAWLDETLAAYEGRQYTPDDLKGAKADRATVNKVEKGLQQAQKAVIDFYNQPVEDFKAKMKAYREKAKQCSAAIDVQIKAVEEAQRQEKKAGLEAVYDEHIGAELKELIPFDKLFDPRWANASTPVSTAKTELLTKIETCKGEIDTLREVTGDDFAACEQVYLQNLSIRDGIAEHKRLAELRQAQERAAAARAAEEAAKAAAPVYSIPSEEEREAAAAGRKAAENNRYITKEGRLDFDLQRFVEAEPEQARDYDVRLYDMTDAKIAAFKQFCAAANIRFGKVK